MKRFTRIFRAKNLLIALALLMANGFAWFMVSSRIDLVEVDPILHPEIAEIQGHWNAGDAIGEPFAVTVTNQMAAETIAWVASTRPTVQSVFSHPFVEVDEEGVTGGGLLRVAGLRVPVFGRANVRLVNGKPDLEILDIGVAQASVPAFVLTALQGQVEQGLAIYDSFDIPVEITTLELQDGAIYLEGIYK